MRNVSSLHPKLQEKITALVQKCIENGLPVGISETLRTEAEQNALYAKGRTAPGSIVTNAKGSSYSSMHQWGIAFDFYRADGKGAYENGDGFFEKVGALGIEIGLMWGGSWKSFKDLPHFQLPDWGETPAKLKRQYGAPENFIESWGVIEMTSDEKLAFAELQNKVETLRQDVKTIIAESEKVYHYTCDLPDWAKPTIQKLLDNGTYAGSAEDDLNLPENVMRTLVINDRAGLYE